MRSRDDPHASRSRGSASKRSSTARRRHVLGALEARIRLQGPARQEARLGELAAVAAQAGDAQVGRPGLAHAEQAPLTADLEVQLGEAEAVAGLGQGPRAGGPLLRRRLAEEQAEARVLAAPDPAAQLVELREPETVGPSTTMAVAFGTSMPTSTTVVAASRSVRPVAKPSMAACFSSLRWPPWASPTVKPRTAPP